jgi:RNA polymerase sigma-70 factor (ECF subfamily)
MEMGQGVGVVAGSSASIEQLLQAQESLKAFIRRRVPTSAIADDLLQQSLMKAVEQVHTVQNKESVIPWFYRLVRHAIIDYYRAQSTDERKYERFLKELSASEADKEPPFDEKSEEVCACLNRLLPALRPAYADLLRRVDLGGESIQSVARDLKLTPNNLTVRLHRARQALRASLEAACGICTKHGCLNCTCE